MRVSIALSVLSWIAFVISDLVLLFGTTNNLDTGIPPQLRNAALTLFMLFVFIYYRQRMKRIENINFIDLLWKVFATGLLTTVLSLMIKFLLFAFENTRLAEDVFVITFSYHINIGLVSSFLISAFMVWKKLILYQKSKFLLRSWGIFEYILLGSLVLGVFYTDLQNPVSITTLTILILLVIFFSVNLKWVAYLNFKQKWKSILLLLLILLYLGYFVQNLVRFLNNPPLSDIPLTTDILGLTFLIALFSFVIIYALFSMLVILFNLPTSSVFEQKLEEVINFQRLSQSIQTEKNEDQVYKILLESSTSTVFADAAWVEVFQNEEEGKFVSHNILESEILEVKNQIKNSKVKGIMATDSEKSISGAQRSPILKGTKYKSIIAYPIVVQGKQIGTLALLKEVAEGFNKEMVNILRTFVNQAGISIENFRLLSEALENERYKEELKIAREVQKSLMPKSLAHNDDFEIFAYSEAADEVGGDYYDTYKIDENRIALIIADVSGKGTSAAFHMSQMKGIFNSIGQLGLSPKEFMINTNIALGASLEKASFITASYYLINKKTKTIEFTRAGHCPTLYYRAKEKRSSYYTDKGLGLGILRNSKFDNYVNVNTIDYASGDILFLYTDGITEAKNMKREEYGYDRLQAILEDAASENGDQIQDKIIKNLFEFCGSELVDDDYTSLIVKFN